MTYSISSIENYVSIGRFYTKSYHINQVNVNDILTADTY